MNYINEQININIENQKLVDASNRLFRLIKSRSLRCEGEMVGRIVSRVLFEYRGTCIIFRDGTFFYQYLYTDYDGNWIETGYPTVDEAIKYRLVSPEEAAEYLSQKDICTGIKSKQTEASRLAEARRILKEAGEL